MKKKNEKQTEKCHNGKIIIKYNTKYYVYIEKYYEHIIILENAL